MLVRLPAFRLCDPICINPTQRAKRLSLLADLCSLPVFAKRPHTGFRTGAITNACSAFTRPSMELLCNLPPELVSSIFSFLPATSLASVCLVNHACLFLSLPILYANMDCINLTGTLSFLRRLARDPAGLVASQAVEVRSIRIPRRPATHEVKAGIAAALANAILLARLPHLVFLDWPFDYIRRCFLEDEYAARFDEPLWEALLTARSKLPVGFVAAHM